MSSSSSIKVFEISIDKTMKKGQIKREVHTLRNVEVDMYSENTITVSRGDFKKSNHMDIFEIVFDGEELQNIFHDTRTVLFEKGVNSQ